MGIGISDKTCQKPIVEEDFKQYDKVADGRLYLSEVDDEQIDCLIAHLIHTKDNNIRTAFRSSIQNDLWEAIKSRLRALKNKELSPEVSDRVNHLLENEYSDDEVIVRSISRYIFSRSNLTNTVEGDSESYRLGQHLIYQQGIVDGNLNYGAWKIEPTASLNVEYFWSDFELDSPMLDAPMTLESNNWGIGSRVGGDVLKRNESIRLSVDGSYSYYKDPLPNQIEFQSNLGGSFNARDIGGLPISMKASADWAITDVTPFSDQLFDPESESVSIYGEAAYMFKKSGLLLTYEHVREDDVTQMLAEETSSHAGSLLTHIVFPKGYIRIGAGGGAWSDDSEMLDGTEAASSGGELHLQVSGKMQPLKFMMFTLDGEANANQSDGTFVGWYPGGNASVGAFLLFEDLQLMLGGEFEGYERNLNEYQQRLEYTANGKLVYAPVDYFNTSIKGSYTSTDQNGYEAYDSSSWQALGDVSFRIFKDIDMWVLARGGIRNISYDSGDAYNSEVDDYALMAQVSSRF